MTPLATVTRAARTLARRRNTLAQAEVDLSDAVRQALAAGVSAVDVAAALGVTRARVYQLRDGTR